MTPATPDDARIARLDETLDLEGLQKQADTGEYQGLPSMMSVAFWKVRALIDRAKRAEALEAELRRTREERDAAEREVKRQQALCVEACDAGIEAAELSKRQGARATTAEVAVARLECENAVLQEALAPFGAYCAKHPFKVGEDGYDDWLGAMRHSVGWSEFDRAARLLAADSEKE